MSLKATRNVFFVCENASWSLDIFIADFPLNLPHNYLTNTKSNPLRLAGIVYDASLTIHAEVHLHTKHCILKVMPFKLEQSEVYSNIAKLMQA